MGVIKNSKHACEQHVPGKGDIVLQTLRRMCYLTIKEMANISEDVIIVTSRCMMDSDDEVRDRATFYMNVLLQKQKALNAAYIFNGLSVSVPGLEKSLHQYTLEPTEKPFDMKTVPLASAPINEQKTEIATVVTSKMPEKVGPSRQDIYQEQLATIPEFKALGPLFKSSDPVQLTEAETEYVVRCIKHTFTNHMVFQFDCTNTLNDQLLQKVMVQMEPSEAYEVVHYVPALDLPYSQPGSCYTLVRLPDDDPTAGLSVSVPGLEKSLHQYTLEPTEKPFDMKTVPLASAPINEQKTEIATVVTSKMPEKVGPSRQDIYQEQLAAIPEFKALGPLFKSSDPVQLTEAETEYVVRCIKHTFTNHMVFQFDCTNTLNDQLLQKVMVQMEPSEAYEVVHYVPALDLPYSQPGSCYTLVRLPDDDPTAVSCTFSCTMKYLVRDCDPNTGEPDEDGYDDEYVLEDLEVTVADHIQRVLKPNFGAAWEEVGDEFEKEETFALASVKTLEEAVGNIISFLGMQPCERSDKVPENKNSHVLFLAGVFRGGHDVLVRSRLALADGVTMQVTVRSTEETAVDVILASVG
ncbi:UNVERIFIED_CONTAM: hypothetical protein FKN15_075750 [Acipenser sinensis]